MEPQRQKWAQNYIQKMVNHQWSWDDISEKLQGQYGVKSFDVDKTLKPYWDSIVRIN